MLTDASLSLQSLSAVHLRPSIFVDDLRTDHSVTLGKPLTTREAPQGPRLAAPSFKFRVGRGILRDFLSFLFMIFMKTQKKKTGSCFGPSRSDWITCGLFGCFLMPKVHKKLRSDVPSEFICGLFFRLHSSFDRLFDRFVLVNYPE